MLFNPEISCRFCARVLCCVDCRIKHERKNHPVEENQIDFFTNFTFGDVQNKILITKRNDLLFLKHIFEHMPLKCIKCFKIFTSVQNFDLFPKCSFKTSLEVKESSIVKENISNSSKNTMSIFSPNTVQIPDNHETSNEKKMFENEVLGMTFSNEYVEKLTNSILSMNQGKLVRTTSTPLQKLLFKFYEKNFNGSNQVSDICDSFEKVLNPSAVHTDTSPNLSDVPKYNITNEKVHIRVKSPLSENEAIIQVSTPLENVKNDKKFSDTPSCLAKSSYSTSVYYSDVPDSVEIRQCYTIESKNSRESIIKYSSVITSPSPSTKYEDGIDVFQSCNSYNLKLITSADIKTKKTYLSKISKSYSFDCTPKAAATNFRNKKVINFADDEVFKSPMKIDNEDDDDDKENKFKNEISNHVGSDQNKDHFGGKIWNLFSSFMRIPSSFGKEYQEKISKINLFSKNQQQQHESTNQKTASLTECNSTIKRKRNSYDDQININNFKRYKFVSGRKPLDSYRKRTEQSQGNYNFNTKNVSPHSKLVKSFSTSNIKK